MGSDAEQHHDQRDCGAVVKGVNGKEITVKYKDGEKKIVVRPRDGIVTYVPGDKSDSSRGRRYSSLGQPSRQMDH